MIHVKPNLSEQQVCFCDEYLVSFNAYRAAINAGYSENTARKGEILHIPKVQEYLRMKMQQRGERLEITHDMILREYAKIAFSSMANYYDERGDLKPMRELTEVEKSAISHLKTTNIAEPDGYIVGAVTQIKLHNKMAALDKIARHLGFFEGKRVAGGELPVAGFEEAVEEVAVAVAAAVEDESSEEIAAAVVLKDERNVAENSDFSLDGVAERAENILTLSPFSRIDAVPTGKQGLGFDGSNSNYNPTETLAVAVNG